MEFFFFWVHPSLVFTNHRRKGKTESMQNSHMQILKGQKKGEEVIKVRLLGVNLQDSKMFYIEVLIMILASSKMFYHFISKEVKKEKVS